MEKGANKVENTFMHNYFVREILSIIKKPEVKEELKRLVKPLVAMLLDQIYPYLFLCMALAVLSFIIVLSTFVIVFNTKPYIKTLPNV